MLCSVTGKALGSREFNRRNATPLSDEANADRQTPDAMRSTPNSDNLLNLVPTSSANTIEDDAFFEGLPVLVQDVTDKLSHLLEVEAESIAVGDLPLNPPATEGIATVPEADPGLETVLCPSFCHKHPSSSMCVLMKYEHLELSIVMYMMNCSAIKLSQCDSRNEFCSGQNTPLLCSAYHSSQPPRATPV